MLFNHDAQLGLQPLDVPQDPRIYMTGFPCQVVQGGLFQFGQSQRYAQQVSSIPSCIHRADLRFGGGFLTSVVGLWHMSLLVGLRGQLQAFGDVFCCQCTECWAVDAIALLGAVVADGGVEVAQRGWTMQRQVVVHR